MAGNLKIKVRTLKESDLEFIYSTWCSSVWASFMSGKKRVRELGLDKDWYFAAQHALAEQILKRSDVYIAHQVGDEDQIFGYIVCEENKGVLHWIYVKRFYRNEHVATRLLNTCLPSKDVRASFSNKTIRFLSKKWGITFDSRLISGV